MFCSEPPMRNIQTAQVVGVKKSHSHLRRDNLPSAWKPPPPCEKNPCLACFVCENEVLKRARPPWRDPRWTLERPCMRPCMGPRGPWGARKTQWDPKSWKLLKFLIGNFKTTFFWNTGLKFLIGNVKPTFWKIPRLKFRIGNFKPTFLENTRLKFRIGNLKIFDGFGSHWVFRAPPRAREAPDFSNF